MMGSDVAASRIYGISEAISGSDSGPRHATGSGYPS